MNIYDDPTRSEETRILLQAAIESANDAIIITEYLLDLPGPRIEYVNPAFTRMTQYSQSEVIGQTPRILQGPRTSRELLSRLRGDLKTGQSFHGETTNYRKDGTEYEVEWRITPVCDRSGKPIKWVAVQRDVTDRVKADAAMKSSEQHLRTVNQDLEQFVFAASHDLQEPIRNVALHSQFLQRSFADAIPESAKGHLGFILEGSQRLGELIRDLLAYARASHLDEEQSEPSTDLNAVVDRVKQDLGTLIKETEAVVEVAELPTIAMQDTELQQIYSNLISNAIRYRRDGHTPIVSLGVAAPPGSQQVSLFVRDNGIGIDSQYYKEIFGVFRRLNKHDSAGTGIGLAIVQRLIEKRGGQIWVESDGASGSTFYFTAPLGRQTRIQHAKHTAG